MDPELVVQTLNFHGQQLTKLWENERGAASLQVASLRDLDYQVYQKRSKDLGFQERGKRIRLHQFIVDKAPQLFKAEKKPKESVNSALKSQDEDFFPLMPPLESFCHFDKSESRTNFFESIKTGDVLIGQVQQKNFHGLIFRVVATEDSTILRDVRELSIKGSILPDQYVSDRKDGAFNTGDLIRCEVLDFNADNEKLVCGMKGLHQPAERADLQFGIITKEQLPKSYKAMVDLTGKSYEECLQSNRTFRNPSAIEHLSKSLGLNLASNVPDSFLKGLNAPIEESDYADELRKSQNSKWATKSVAEGIKYFKSGMENEAFQCLNKALHIDPVNIEGLVARGALYANRGSYDKAITDFEAALKERPNHTNATNYLSETLVAYAKQYEDEKNIDAAIQLYQKCLGVNPSHQEARSSLQRLSKSRQRPNFNIDFLDMENGSSSKALTGKATEDTEQKDEGRKSRRHRKRGKRGSSSSSSKSGSSSSSRFSSSGSESSRGRSRSKKSRRSKKTAKHEPSLSPFSKKMAQLNPSNAATLAGDISQAAPSQQATSFYPSTEYPSISTQPHPVPPPPAFGALGGNPPPPAFAGYASSSGASGAPGQTVGYEKEVQNFIQRTALNEEYEKKVELFLQRVGKGGKDGEKKEEKEKDKKKKKKKDRSKDKKKKDGKRDKNKEKKHKKKKKGSDDEDSDKQISPNLSGLDELGELEAKLSAVYNKLTAKESSKKKKKRKRHSSNSSDSSSSSGSSSDSELERKKRKAKKALEDLAAAAGLLRGGESKLNVKPEPVPPPSYVPTPGAAGMSASTGGASGDDDDYPGKWRPMALKVKLGRGSDEPEVEESRMVYMKEEKRLPQPQIAPVEQEEELPPGDFREDKVSFKIQSFGLFGPGPRQAPPKPVSPPKTNEQAQLEANQEKERGSRSRSRSQRRRSRSRSQSRSRSRGRSYSRSGSRSRSRSGSYRRRRSRSHSGDRRHQNQRYRGGNRHPNQNYHHRGGRYPQRGGFQNRGRGWNNNFNNNRGGYNNRPYNNRPYHNNNNNQGGYDNRRHRGRNRGGYWQQQMQRSYSRSRSRSRTRSRSRSRSRSYSRSVSRSPSRSRSRSRQDNYRGRDRDARDNRDARDASPHGRNDQEQHRNDRESGEREMQHRSPAREEKPGPVPAPAVAITPSASSQSDRRKVGSKWDDGGGDDDEDLVPPGCE